VASSLSVTWTTSATGEGRCAGTIPGPRTPGSSTSGDERLRKMQIDTEQTHVNYSVAIWLFGTRHSAELFRGILRGLIYEATDELFLTHMLYWDMHRTTCAVGL
jgi:hypothetical protein